MLPQIKQHQATTTNNPHYATKSEILQLLVAKCPIDGGHMGTPKHIACNYQTKVTTINHCPSNPNLTHVVAKEVAKPQDVVVPQIKQRQVAITNNPQHATKSEFLQLQVKKSPTNGQHMGAS